MTAERDARRLSFGTDAEQYDRSRPTYPAEIIDAICGDPSFRRVVDVGCGTGIASRLFLARGCDVIGVEADERMAAVARRRGVPVDVSPFETWDAPAEPFDVVAAGQSWHWVDPAAGPAKAASVLGPGGRLALFWNGYGTVPMRPALDDVYRRWAPELVGTSIVLTHEPRTRSRHIDEIDASGLFGPVSQLDVSWTRVYSRDEWLDQLQTHSDHRVLAPDVRARVLDGVGAVIDENGGSFEVPHTTRLLLASKNP